MFGSATLEIAIGMIFIFLLLSLVCSTINEWIASILNLRGKTLQSGIRRLLEDPDGKWLAGEFYNHPVIRGLSRGESQVVLPSYISAETFTTVLMDLLAPQEFGNPKPLREVYGDIHERIQQIVDVENTEFGRVIMLLLDETGLTKEQLKELADGWEQVKIMRESLKELQAKSADEIDLQQVQSLMQTITRMEAKLTLAEQRADQAIAQARQKIGDHFDQAMDRVSGWYKRQTAISIFGISLVVSVLLNVDSISLASSLANNPTLRSAVVASAENGVSELRGTVGELTEETGAQDLVDEINQLGLPIGWTPQTTPENPNELINRILGWIVTTIAVSMGAPFWFDLLSRVSSLRIAGNKPDKMAPAPQQVISITPPTTAPQITVTSADSSAG
ncbi:MAG: hypothetical protein AAGD96_08175 [Chloroflexota bacterium]